MSEAIELAEQREIVLPDALVASAFYRTELDALYEAVLEVGIQRGRELERDELSKQEPVGYLPEHELNRLSSGHDARLRSAKFGPSALDGDVPLYAKLIP